MQLPVRDVHALLQSADPSAAPVLLDVREAWEVQLAAIRSPAAPTLHIPMQEIPARLAELPRDRPILCYCHHGMRSMQVVRFLHQQGYDEALNVAGGIEAWSLQVDPGVPRY
ncbi:rhodanese-like domain-containing protein [Caldimonas tepidiphila]|uniref:rhodanese-like domain-containing protein n=1 Tax=Caldimonas tepidiphila TaxID=2315841 RepID=UPI000E5A2036|nr:rhodanese-like domain-containing protein [Caldimonas tepidiphila]